ncbi:MAG TPA: serine/threonine-protein kinase [Acidimicrobiia bacterium]
MSFDEELSERYEILEEVGRGSQATVVRARDRNSKDRFFALKIYAVGPETNRDDLVSEVDVLLRLPVHPNLPVVRNDFFLDDRYVIVMDWIDGTNLQHVLDHEGAPGLPLDRVVGYVDQLASALDHLQGSDPPVVHGDVKPANVVLTTTGRIVLVDFGLVGGRTGRGSRGFCAPEVSAGNAATPEADIYGMGATAWTLLTGEPPQEGAAPPIDLDPRVVDALRPSLATSPIARPEIAAEVAAGLALALGPAPMPAVPVQSSRPTVASVADTAFAPTTLVVTGGVAAVTVGVGLALPIVVGAGAVTWGICTLVARRRQRPEPIRPEILAKEWGTFVRDAQRAQERYAGAWRRASDGPLRDRLSEIGRSVDAGVWECWTVAKRGDALQQALRDLDLDRARVRLAGAESDREAAPSPTKERTVASLTARVESGQRMSDLLDEAREQLQMLDARLDEIVISALELVHKSGSLGTVTAVGSAVDEVVQELQTLATALDEAADGRQDR